MSDNTWCEVKSVPCTCKNGICPNSKGNVTVVEEVVNIVNVVKERKVNRDPGDIKRVKR
jgi:hypothetical protein